MKGANSTSAGGERSIVSSYYLGTPPDLDMGGTGARVIFFHGVSEGLQFNPASQ